MRGWAEWLFGGAPATAGRAGRAGTSEQDMDATVEPEDLQCTISALLFRDPVMLISGHTFERASIVEFWLRRPLVNPLGTGERLRSAQMIINFGCRSQVDSFLENNPGYTPDGWESRSVGHRSSEAELEVITRRVEAAAKEADDLAAADAADEEVTAQLLLAAAAPRVYLVGATPDGVHRDYLGAYDRQEEPVNDRLAYAMQGNADNMLWFSSTNGYWHAGPRANLGSPRGWLAVFDRTPLPERILAEWQVGAANAGWTPAPEVRCLAGMAGEAAFAAMGQVQGTIPVALEEAATNIYLVGDTGEGVNHKYVGAYARGAQIVNGRFTYSRVGEGGDPMRMLWYCSAEGGQWWAGPRNNLGTAVGWLAVNDKALAPEDISATWRAVLRDGGWLSTPKLRCLIGEAGEGVHLQEVEAQRKRELDETHELLLAAAERVHLIGTTPDGAHRDYLGAYDRETELVNGRPAYVMHGNVEKMLWFSSVNGYWHAGPRANLGGPRGWLAVYDRAPLPERVTGEWQVGAVDSSWTAAPDVRCLVANPPQQPTAAAVGFPDPRHQDDARPRRARRG